MSCRKAHYPSDNDCDAVDDTVAKDPKPKKVVIPVQSALPPAPVPLQKHQTSLYKPPRQHKHLKLAPVPAAPADHIPPSPNIELQTIITDSAPPAPPQETASCTPTAASSPPAAATMAPVVASSTRPAQPTTPRRPASMFRAPVSGWC